ncbi:MAG: methylmalonyl Co-A mutase-associated GTPase MeaB [Desulfurococcales archaeon]|nr:methylmalonyl Co-A mutase-associated GTPase MeaB [Desulfurococcales archaeon]MCE4629879.1 methylmalonyl Co-A mutase-associated GTPase MeaB [Desulfurococcales archaeon]
MSKLAEKYASLVERAVKGDLRALGRLLSVLENIDIESAQLLEELASKAGRAHVIGVTGIPGAGKSTLIGKLISGLRKRGYKVAVVAIDPSSPLTSGALMGDRLRMQEFVGDRDVFIRSLSTRGLKGGLSLAAIALIEAFDALGYDKIIVETVGVGQAEVDIMNAAHTILVLTMPGAGDDIQALKAGVMEIGDIYVVNKADKPEATKTYEYITFAVEKGDIGPGTGWIPKVVKTSAVMGTGIDELVDVIEEHWNYVKENKLDASKVIARRKLLIALLAENLLRKALEKSIEANSEELDEAARRASDLVEKALWLSRGACSTLQ